jgi:SAM-dependent methyltransferase
MICESCGFIFTNPRFSEKDLEVKYNTIKELGSVKYRLKKNPPSNLDKRANRIYNLINKFFNYTQEATPTILDYGGASGYNLLPFVNSFKCGILDYEKWVLPAGVEYLGKDLSDLKDIDKFDVILLLHTLEHVIHPKNFIDELSKHLNENGILYVEVPLGCFREWKFIREPLTHINFFSEESLFKCFELCDLSVIYLATSYQWVTHGKMWCLNIIGSRQKYRRLSPIKNVLSTKKQMSKINYYFPYLFNGRVIGKVLRK